MTLGLAWALLLAADLPDFDAGCTEANAQAVTVGELRSAPERFAGRCVSVRVVLRSSGFLLGEDDPVPPGTGVPDHLGIFERTPLFRAVPKHVDSRWTLIGIASHCRLIAAELLADNEARRAEEIAAGRPPPPPPMLAGDCHWFSSPVVFLSSFRETADRPNGPTR
jgi:hypothetical protein